MPSLPLPLARLRSIVVAVVLTLLATPVLLATHSVPARASTFGQAVVDEAARHYGAPYLYGGVGPTSFDCSGFTSFIYREFGVNLPRTAAEQYTAVPHVAQDQKDVGDLIFMYDASGIYHVGIYSGNNQIWAATHTGDVVRPEAIWTTAYLVGRPVNPNPTTPIGAHWMALGGAAGFLGQPVTGELPTPDRVGVYTHYANGGSIYWTPSTGAQSVHGLIRDTWSRLAWEAGPVGYPTTDELPTPNGLGRYNHFTGSGGASIYWTPATGAHAVLGNIRATWAQLGWEAGRVGFPTTDELPTPDGIGRYNHFDGQGAGASIYWTPRTGAQEVQGSIRAEWSQLRWESGPLGYPVTNELPTPDGIGRFNHFDGKGAGASVYWSPQTGAHAVVGSVRTAWAQSGWEKGPLGYPVADEHATPDGLRRTDFVHGFITVNPVTGTTVVHTV